MVMMIEIMNGHDDRDHEWSWWLRSWMTMINDDRDHGWPWWLRSCLGHDEWDHAWVMMIEIMDGHDDMRSCMGHDDRDHEWVTDLIIINSPSNWRTYTPTIYTYPTHPHTPTRPHTHPPTHQTHTQTHPRIVYVPSNTIGFFNIGTINIFQEYFTPSLFSNEDLRI